MSGRNDLMEQLKMAMKNENEVVRWCVVEALGNIRSEWAVELLMLALQDESKEVREMAAWKLS